MLTRVFDRVYTIKPEYDKKEFTRRIVLKLLEDDNLPADIFDIEFGEVQLNYDNVIAVADCKIHTKYDGSIGYERKEDYWDKEQKRDSNGKIYYVDVKKTRTITDWHPYSGESDSTDKVYVDGISATIGCFSEGLSRFNDSRFKCEKLFKQIDESLIVEEGAADLEDKFFVAFRRLCEYDVHVYYDRALPGDRKELRYDSDIEFENIVCYIIPTYSVKYI